MHCGQNKSSGPSHYVADMDDKKTSLFLRLPFDVRYIIYQYSLISSRTPPAEFVHEKLLSKVWKDKPSPLLSINKQVRVEMVPLLRKSPFTMRITWQDRRFDALALSSFIVQQRRQAYDDIPHLVVEIWPPHPDRPIDAYHIYEQLRLLREDLRAISRISKLDLVFLENGIATWVMDDGKVPNWLGLNVSGCPVGPRFTDIGHMLDLFEGLTNVGTARICLPDSLDDAKYHEMHDHVQATQGIIMGTVVPEHDAEKKQPEDYIAGAEMCLKFVTARIARNKLEAITKSRPMNEFEYSKFVEIWPHFEILEKYGGEGEFDVNDYVTMSEDYWE